MMFYKRCKKCNQWKLSDCFHNDAKRKDGVYIYCKECHYKYMRNRYANQPGVRQTHLERSKAERLLNPEINKERGAKYYRSFHGRAKTLFRGAYKRDAAATVTLEHITRMIEVGVCPRTGIAFDLSSGYRGSTGRHNNPLAPSLDQIAPGAGYSNENTQVVIWQYNQMKGQCSDREILAICQAVVRTSDAFA